MTAGVEEGEVGLVPGPGQARQTREPRPGRGRAVRGPGVGAGGERVREAEVPAEVGAGGLGGPGAGLAVGLATEEGPGVPGGGLALTGEDRDQGRPRRRSWRGRDSTWLTWTAAPASGTWRKSSRDSVRSRRSGWPRVFPASPSWCSSRRKTPPRPAGPRTARISVGGECGSRWPGTELYYMDGCFLENKLN